jgi:hypothetical protein
LGSFGSELEEAPIDNVTLFSELSPVKSAIEQAKSIMKASIGTDDELADAVAGSGAVLYNFTFLTWFIFRLKK